MTFDWNAFQDAPSAGQKEKAEGGEGGFDWNQYEDFKQPSLAESGVKQIGRKGMQFGIGLVQKAALPFDIGAIGAKHLTEANQPQITRERLFEDVEQMQEQKQTGVWNPQDEQRLQETLDLIKNPQKAEQYFKEAPSLDSGSIIEKGFEKLGVDAKPQDIAEMALRWTGWTKGTTKAAQLLKNPYLLAKDPKMILKIAKDLVPKGSELARGGGAAVFMEGAMQMELGPIGTLAAGIVGDYLGGGVAGVAKGIPKFVKAPIETTKQALAKGAAKFTNKDKLELQKELIRDFRNAGIQADLGTITDSNLMKGFQAALSQSRFTGKALDNFREQLREDIVGQYKQFANKLGEERFASQQEAGEALVQKSKEIRDLDKTAHTEAYEVASAEAANANAIVLPRNLQQSIAKLERKLTPGKVKSTEQKSVLKYLDELKGDILDESGNIKAARVEDLINNKIALGDVVNYEVQGGAKQLLRGIIKDIDAAIEEYGAVNPKFQKSLAEANKKFGQHAKTFRNKDVDALIRGENPMTLMNKMNTPQGIRRIGAVLNKTKEGRELFGQLKRFKLDELIGNRMVDSVTQQMKLGTFTNLLSKGKTKELVREMMSPAAFARFERLTQMTGKLAESSQRFFNASKSGTTAGDLAWAANVMNSLMHMSYLNPWPLIATGAKLLAPVGLSKLIANPEFLQMVEEAVLASSKNNKPLMSRIATNMKNRFFPNQKGPTTALKKSPQFNSASESGGPQSPASSSNTSADIEPAPSETARIRTPSSSPDKTMAPAGNPADLSLGSINTSNNKIITQESNNPRELLQKANKLKKPFIREVYSFIEDVPGTKLKSIRTKKDDSLSKKLKRTDHQPNTIPDYLGARVTVDSQKSMDEVLQRIEEAQPLEVDNFLDKSKNEWGYRAVHTQIRIDGMSGELQIIPKPISKIQGWMHSYYKKWQETPMKEKMKIPEYHADVDKVMKESHKAMAQFKKG